MKKTILGMALLASLALAGRAAAQLPAGLVIGDTVRVVTPSVGEEIRGALAALRGDTLFVRRNGVTHAVPMSQAVSIDVRRRRSRLAGMGRGAAYGAPIGLASGYLAGTVLERGGSAANCGDGCGLVPAILGLGGLAVGTGFGALLGVTVPGSRWDRVDWHPPLAVGAAYGGGVALSVRVKL